MTHCPNCGTEWPGGADACPRCGFVRPDVSASWPPTPTNRPPDPLWPYVRPAPKLLTGAVWGDLTLGVGLTLASFFVACLGLVVMPVLYFALRPTLPVFARGIGYGLLGYVALLLGAFAFCTYGSGWGPGSQ